MMPLYVFALLVKFDRTRACEYLAALSDPHTATCPLCRVVSTIWIGGLTDQQLVTAYRLTLLGA